MKYWEYLDDLKNRKNPFSDIKQEEWIDSTQKFVVIPNRGPYVQDHILIIPKEYKESVIEISGDELEEMYNLINKWTKKLYTKYEGKTVNILLRDGKISEKSNKSVSHLHWHLIPDAPIGYLEESFVSNEREFFSTKKYLQEVERMKSEFWMK